MHLINRLLRIVSLTGFLLVPTLAYANTFELPPAGHDVVGEIQVVVARHEDTLLDIGRKYGVGYEALRRANPGVDMWLPGEGTEVILPTQFVLPDVDREGIVVNVAEMRLYYFPPAADGEKPVVETYAISVGRMDWSTPIGKSKIVSKDANPTWFPPQSILDERAAQGRPLPRAVPPGPDNPLGGHRIRLDIPGGAYLIHGTNDPRGIGMRVTHGCIRMFPEDVESLFERVPVGTQVHIINQPVKAGWLEGDLYVEAHPVLPPEAENAFDPVEPPELRDAVLTIAGQLNARDVRIDHERLKNTVATANGLPNRVTRQNMPAQEFGLAE